jgi:hypothetical protein
VRIPEPEVGLARSPGSAAMMAAAWQISGSDPPHRESGLRSRISVSLDWPAGCRLSRTADVSISAITGESARYPNGSRQLDPKQIIVMRAPAG